MPDTSASSMCSPRRDVVFHIKKFLDHLLCFCCRDRRGVQDFVPKIGDESLRDSLLVLRVVDQRERDTECLECGDWVPVLEQ